MQQKKSTHVPYSINLEKVSIQDIKELARDRKRFQDRTLGKYDFPYIPNDYNEISNEFYTHNNSELHKAVIELSIKSGLKGHELIPFLSFITYEAKVRDLIQGLESFTGEQMEIVQEIFNNFPKHEGAFSGTIQDFMDLPLDNDW